MAPDTTCPRCQGSGVDYTETCYGSGGDSGLPSSFHPLCQGCEGCGEVCPTCHAPPSEQCPCPVEAEEAPSAESLGVGR